MSYFYDDRPSKGTAPHAGPAPQCSCESCKNGSTMLYAFIDRHGDISQLCERCYKLAIKPQESPELARRDRRFALWFAVIGTIALAFVLFGCSTAPQRMTGNGKPEVPNYGYTLLCAGQPDLATCNAIRLQRLKQINAEINAYPADEKFVGVWTPITQTGGGTCGGYATAKLETLAAEGWPRESLRLALVRISHNATTLHLILLVDVGGQTWALDNLRALPTEYQLLSYQWLQIQAATGWEGV